MDSFVCSIMVQQSFISTRMQPTFRLNIITINDTLHLIKINLPIDYLNINLIELYVYLPFNFNSANALSVMKVRVFTGIMCVSLYVHNEIWIDIAKWIMIMSVRKGVKLLCEKRCFCWFSKWLNFETIIKN